MLLLYFTFFFQGAKIVFFSLPMMQIVDLFMKTTIFVCKKQYKMNESLKI